jgi:hypothetical protein
MPSPDATPYIDLTIYDLDQQDIYEKAEIELLTNLPDWVPREGNVEVLLLEAMAGQVAEAVFAVNRLPNGILEALLLLYGIERDTGTPPTADLTFTMSDTLGHTIVAGTEARLTLAGGLEPIVFTTDIDLVIAPGSDDGTVAATGDRFTAEANNTTSNTVVELLDSLLYVESVTLTIDAGGTEPETDLDYYTRGTTRFSRLSETLVLPKHFESYALEQTYVERAKSLDNWDGSGGSPGDDPGHITVAVYGNGALVSGGNKTILDTEMEALTLANLEVHVIDPTVTTVNVTTQVKGLVGYLAADVQASVEEALEDYLSPMTWEWSTTVRRNELITVISNVEGVDYVDTLTTPASDTALSGHATLVTFGTISVTVI